MSLNKLSLDHPWLLTHPIFWTAQHLDLLHCHFEPIEDAAGNAVGLVNSTANELQEGPGAASCLISGSKDPFSEYAEIFAKSRALRHRTYSLINLLVNDRSGFKKYRSVFPYKL